MEESNSVKNLIEIRDLTYKYSDGTQALAGVNLDIRQGEKLVVVGSNGSGKSTLFLCLNGVLKASSGSILFQGEKFLYDKKSLLNIRKNIGIVFQDPETQLFCLNVYQEVAFGPSNLGLKKQDLADCVQRNLELMQISHLQDRPPHFLSGGQKKQVSIASVIAMNPKLIIFDEPTSALDSINAKLTLDLMAELNQQGITVIVSTHDVDMAYEFADRVAIMQDGIVASIGEPEQIFTDELLLQNTGVKPPQVLQFFQQLRKHDILPNGLKPPKSLLELGAYLDNYK